MSEESSSKKKNWFKRHKVITGILAALIIFGVIGAVSDNNNNPHSAVSTSSSTSSNTGSRPAPTTSTTPGINQAADDGKFQFTVTSFKCGVTQIIQSDNQYEVATPQGQFCEMDLSVKNIDNVPQSFDDSSQYIYDASSKQYNDDSSGTIAANPTSSQFMEYPNVNPGVTISGTLAFDIPKGVIPTYAMLHDSGASNGVKVALQ